MSRQTYQRFVVWFAVAALFTNLSLYLFLSGRTGVPPLYPILLVGALTVPLALDGQRLAVVLSAPLFAWTCVYLALSVFAYMHSSRSPVAQQELETRILSCAQLVVYLLVLSDEHAARTMKQAILFSLIVLGVGLNLYEILAPMTFSVVLFRSAGLYVNPNISATVLALAGLLTLDEVGARWRPRLLTLLTVGILTTMSRATLLAWIPMLPVLAWAGLVSGRRLMLAISATVLLAAAVLVPTGLLATAWELYQGSSIDALTRIVSPFGAGANVDFSAGVRIDMLRRALQTFAEHPLLGAGLGATLEWAYLTRPHNIYASLLAEHGVLGGLIYPAAVVAAALGFRRWSKEVVLAALFLLWSGLFSDNMLEPPALLMLLALMGMRNAARASLESRATAPLLQGGRAPSPIVSTAEIQS